jgi:Flp pilus assembly protein TadG
MTPFPFPAARRAGERGIVTVEFVAVIWLFMILVLGATQFGLWWHAQHVVLGAAQDAARVLAAEAGTPTASQHRAQDLLRAGLGRDATTATIRVHRNTELAQVTVTAWLRPLLPISRGIRLHATAHSYAEGFRPDSRGFGDSEVPSGVNPSAGGG